jgi:tRNA dimethylallyltransferase
LNGPDHSATMRSEERATARLSMPISQDRFLIQYGRPQASPKNASTFAAPDSRILTASCVGVDPSRRPGPPAIAGESFLAGYPLVIIAGPTGSGKTALALHLAEIFRGEIVNYDSVQVYRGADVGSGKVSSEVRRRISHHLLDVLEPDQLMTAGYFRLLALKALTDIRKRRQLPILAGGTGLYLRALLQGLFAGPARSEHLRVRLREMEARHRAGFLHRLLARLDPQAASRVHPHDTQKVIRCVEVCLLSGQPISRLHSSGREALSGFEIIRIGLNPPRAALYRHIDQRTAAMFAGGLVEEVRALLERQGDSRGNAFGPLNALGYRQAARLLRGEIDAGRAVRDAQAATRRYAKRQLTWFRREPGVTWFRDFGHDPELQLRAARWLQGKLR